MNKKYKYSIFSITLIACVFGLFFNAQRSTTEFIIVGNIEMTKSGGTFLNDRNDDIVFDVLDTRPIFPNFYQRELDNDYPYRLGLNMVRAGSPYAKHDFVYKDLENLGAQGIRQIQGHDFNWSVVWKGYGEGVGDKNNSGYCRNVPLACSEEDCWYIEPTSSKVKHKEDAFVPGNFLGTNEDFSNADNYDFTDSKMFMSKTDFYYQPTLFITGLAQNRQHFICIDEEDESEGFDDEEYCHENGAKSSDIEQCQWIYTPNGHKVKLKDSGNYHDEIYDAVKSYLSISAETAAHYGVHHFEIGNELERFPHPGLLGVYNWNYIDRYYMRLLKLSKKALSEKFEELGQSEEPQVMFAGLFSTEYDFDGYSATQQPHNLDFLAQVLKEISSDMKDEGTDINDYFDIFNFHHYQGWTTLRSHINNLKEIFTDKIDDNVLDDISFWATELGLTTGDISNGPFEIDDNRQGEVEYYCDGHAVNWQNGISLSDITSSTESNASENCESKFVDNTLKESRNMIKYMAIAWANGVKLINWHTHLQNSNFYLGLRVKYNKVTTAMEGCLENEDDPTMEEFNYNDHQNYCAKTSWFVYRMIAEKLGNWGKSREIHYDNNGWFLYLFSQKQYDNGATTEPRFVSWLGCPDNGGDCSNVSGKTESITIYKLMKNLSDDQKDRYNNCLQVTDLDPTCSGNKKAFCSKFSTQQYRFSGDGGNVTIPVKGVPSIIEPCD
jgi:hypothetical protein